MNRNPVPGVIIVPALPVVLLFGALCYGIGEIVCQLTEINAKMK